MIGVDERITWGAEGLGLYGVIQRKKVGNAGELEPLLDRRGSVIRLPVRDRHTTVAITATVTDEVNEDNIPLVGDPFTVEVNGRPVEFTCEGSDLESFPEDASILTITGRTFGTTPVGRAG